MSAPYKQSILLVMLAALLSACASKPMITDVDVQSHQQAGDLSSFRESLQDEMKLLKPESELAANRQFYFEKTGQLIAEEKEQKVLDGLDREFGKHSILDLKIALSKASDIQLYNEQVYVGLRQQFEQAINQKKGVILSKEAEYYELTDKHAVKKVAILDEIVKIYGEDSTESQQVKSQRKEYIDSLFQKAQEAIIDKKYKKVETLLTIIEEIQPDYNGLSEVHLQLVVAEYELDFWDALESGQRDKAYATFVKLAETPSYIETHADIQPVAEDLAQFFVEEGDEAVKNKARDLAYISYSRSTYIYNSFVKVASYSVVQKKYIESIDKRFKWFWSKSQFIPAYGALLVLAELMPEHPSVAQFLQQVEDAVHAEARIKVISSGIVPMENNPSLAVLLVNTMNDVLQANVQGVVELIDGKASDFNYSAANILKLPNPDAFYMLSGELVDASVIKNEELEQTSTVVVTGYVDETNPAYVEWEDLSRSKKKEIPAPPEFLKKAVEKDLVLSKTVIQQNASVELKYLLASAVSSSVLFSDNLVTKKQHITENVPAMKEGDYIREAKLPELLDEQEMMNKLIVKTANLAVEKLLKQFEHLSEDYLKSADKAVVLEDFKMAASNYAYSYVLGDKSTVHNNETLAHFKIYSLRWQ